jgi:hypothetical protein
MGSSRPRPCRTRWAPSKGREAAAPWSGTKSGPTRGPPNAGLPTRRERDSQTFCPRRWDSKLQFGFWRPITAIHRARRDDNPRTAADADRESLIPTPPYPDDTSGLSAVIGAASRALAGILGTNRIDLRITSVAAVVTRNYEFAGQINRDVVDARVWSGIHFRTADVLGSAMGKKVGDWAVDRYFRPLDDVG